MHPITAIHDWIVGHPVAFTLTLFLLALPVSIYSAEIKAFLKIPPQRLGVWILKARINATLLRIARIQRIRQEPAYAMLRLFIPTVFVLGAILVFAAAAYTSIAFPKDDLIVHREWSQAFLFFGPAVVLARTMRDFNGAVGDKDPLPQMIEIVEKLKAKLPLA